MKIIVLYFYMTGKVKIEKRWKFEGNNHFVGNWPKLIGNWATRIQELANAKLALNSYSCNLAVIDNALCMINNWLGWYNMFLFRVKTCKTLLADYYFCKKWPLSDNITKLSPWIRYTLALEYDSLITYLNADKASWTLLLKSGLYRSAS